MRCSALRPQTITRHGVEIAVIIDMAEYRRLAGPKKNFADYLMTFPELDTKPDEPDVFGEIEAERKRD